MDRLLVYTENYNVAAGGASFIVDLCNGVAELYDEVVFVSNPDTNAFAPDTAARVVCPNRMIGIAVWTVVRAGVTVGRMPLLRRLGGSIQRLLSPLDELAFAYNTWVCRRAIRTIRPRAVLAFNGGYPAGRSVLSMVVAARLEEVPVALCVVSTPFPRPERKLGTWEVRMDERVAESADVIIVNAQAIGAALTSVRGLPTEKIRVVHNALEEIGVPAPALPRAALRVGCVSRIDSLKGMPYLVRAFAVLAREHPEAELVIVGDGYGRPDLESLVRDLGLADCVTMTGYYPGDVNEMVVSFDIYAFPSLWEGLPYSILEAMRLDRPIVATDVGGISEAIIDGSTGILVPKESVEALARALSTLAADPALRQRLGNAARVKFEAEFTLDFMHRAVRDVFIDATLASRP